ncbi:MAG: 4-phosphoerythronate dehydrogenase [Bacteroidales bacterium]|nr:4-phosphoerythronate dehydrogenase [Bacteroidales bacterium]
MKRELHKVVIDNGIPFIEGVFEPYCEVLYKDGPEITHDDVIDADALIIRTRTRCDEDFLSGSSIKIIATATIGTDHIDLDWCRAHSIKVYNAQGCNAGGVMQYVFSALYGIAARKAIKLEGATFGIIGVGHVGGKVERMARALGFNVLLCDPPREAVEGPDDFCSLDYLLENSHIVTMHTPLDETTRDMADGRFFSLMRPGAIFINTSRGEVVVEEALLEARSKLGAIVIDTGRGEPDINKDRMKTVDIATPHIAGYSLQGKINGTASAVQAVARYFGIKALYRYEPSTDNPEHEPVMLDLRGKNQGEIASIFQYNYPIFTDDFMFRHFKGDFAAMRNTYKYRREISIEL